VQLQLKTNRKLHTGFRLVPVSMTLNYTLSDRNALLFTLSIFSSARCRSE